MRCAFAQIQFFFPDYDITKSAKRPFEQRSRIEVRDLFGFAGGRIRSTISPSRKFEAACMKAGAVPNRNSAGHLTIRVGVVP